LGDTSPPTGGRGKGEIGGKGGVGGGEGLRAKKNERGKMAKDVLNTVTKKGLT